MLLHGNEPKMSPAQGTRTRGRGRNCERNRKIEGGRGIGLARTGEDIRNFQAPFHLAPPINRQAGRLSGGSIVLDRITSSRRVRGVAARRVFDRGARIISLPWLAINYRASPLFPLFLRCPATDQYHTASANTAVAAPDNKAKRRWRDRGRKRERRGAL